MTITEQIYELLNINCMLLNIATIRQPYGRWDKEEPIDKRTMTFQMTLGMAEYLLFLEPGPKERQCIVVLKEKVFS